MITNTIYYWLLLLWYLLGSVSTCCSSPLSMQMPQMQLVPYQKRFLLCNWNPPLYKVVIQPWKLLSVTTLSLSTTSLSWSSLSNIAGANGPSNAWLFYEFRTPYRSTLTLKHGENKKSPVNMMTYMTCIHRYCYCITFTTWLIQLIKVHKKHS